MVAHELLCDAAAQSCHQVGLDKDRGRRKIGCPQRDPARQPALKTAKEYEQDVRQFFESGKAAKSVDKALADEDEDFQ